MTRYYQLGGERVPYLYSHLGGTALIPNGGTVSLVLPDGVQSVYMRPENGKAYYAVNLTAAGTVTMGYVPSDGTEMIMPVDNMGTVSVYAAAGVTVHTQYYSG